MILAAVAVHRHRFPPFFPLQKITGRSVAGFRCGLLNQFDIDRDVHVIAHDHTSIVERGVPLHAEVLPVDFCCCRSREPLVAQGSFTGAVGPSTSSTTSLVVPRMVRSPVALSFPGAICSTFLDLKVIVG